MNSSILIVDDEPGAIQVMARMLDDLGEIYVATSGPEALTVAHRCKPDLLLLDANMPGMNGFDVCRAFKADPELADIPIIFVTAQSSPEFEVAGFDLGAADFISKPVQSPLVRARVKTQIKIKHLTDELRRQANEDALTGIPTRRRFDDALRRELIEAEQTGSPLSLLIIDIDYFKLYNDHYGHQAGDTALREVAQTVAQACRGPGDLAARMGGEEFAVLLPQTSLEHCATVSRRILDALTHAALPHRGIAPTAHVSVSIGASTYQHTARTDIGTRLPAGQCLERISSLLSSADCALYEAKRTGRNRACGLPMADASHGALPYLIAEPSQLSSATH